MPAVQTICMAVLVLVVLVFDKCFGYPSIKLRREERPIMCEPCGDSCKEKCEFGVTTVPFCGEVCAKGLGKICGGPNDIWGICGDGMYCHCNQCHGCSEKGLNCKDTETDDNCHHAFKNPLRFFLFA